MLNSTGGGMHHSLLSPGTKDFTHFHFAYKVNAPLKPKLGGAGVSNDWCITSWKNSITWSEMGKQNVQAEKVYCKCFLAI